MQFTERSFGTGWLVGQSSGFEACYAQAAPRLVAQLFYAFGDVEEARDLRAGGVREGVDPLGSR